MKFPAALAALLGLALMIGLILAHGAREIGAALLRPAGGF